MIRIQKNNFAEFLKVLNQDYKVFAPSGSSFKEVDRVEEIEISTNNTKIPKEIFFPQTEVLFKFKDNRIEENEQDKPIAVWGVRPCSTKAFTLINKIFGQAKQKPGDENFADPYWKARYDHSLIFTMGCNTPDTTCFCNWVNGGPFDATGSDIMVYNTDDVFLMEAISKKGKTFIEILAIKEEPSNRDKQNLEALKNIAEAMLSKSIDKDILNVKMNKSWSSQIWDRMSAKCINCGACTFNCPTCHCFDIQDEGKAKKGKRIRIWDSCMFQDFTNEASGHNPRALSKDRFRQRFMHKFKYFLENNGDYLCTGCGHCITDCPVNVDIREVLQTIISY